MIHNNRGITLIALIVSIVILLILSSVTMLEVNHTQIFEQAKRGAAEYKKAEKDEELKIQNLNSNMRKWIDTVPNDLKVGDFIEYDVEYKDMKQTSQFYKKYNAWRVIDPGVKYKDGTYEGVKLISTGMPADLVCNTDEIDNYVWKPTEEEVRKYKQEVKYYKGTDNTLRLLAGLYYHTGDIKIFKNSQGFGKGQKQGLGWALHIEKEGKEITKDTTAKELFIIPELAERVECPTLDLVQNTMKLENGETLNLQDSYKNKEIVKGIWDLSKLEFANYTVENYGHAYWIGTDLSYNPGEINGIVFTNKKVEIMAANKLAMGFRPIVVLKPGTKVTKSNFEI